MCYTLQDVLSHSAFIKYIVPKTQADIEHMRDILLDLQKLDKVLLCYKTQTYKAHITEEGGLYTFC